MCLRDLQPLRLRQPALPFVKGPESFRLEFQCAGHMQSIKRSRAELRPVAASQISAKFVSVLRYGHFSPRPCLYVMLEQSMQLSGFDFGQGPAKYVLRYGMKPFSAMQWRQETIGQAGQHLIRRMRVAVSQIERRQETGVGVSGQ